MEVPMKRLPALATAVAASVLIILGAGTASADGKPDNGSARIGTAPITEGLQKIVSGSFLLDM
ncbi:hypothetical protein AOB60_16540 [Streptomyces noursei]|uniref:Uncharacterized protein n=2 Tax=Streptomyces TaxID=1883 RepID=A0A2N8PMB5_STRNR|nr:hypothetical protein AOB60_16540 [Streptomyces noursei]